MPKIILIDEAEFLLEWCEYAWVLSWIYCGRSAKTAILHCVGFLKTKNSRACFRLIFENSFLKGFSWQNRKKSLILVLKINSRYLQSSGLKHTKIGYENTFRFGWLWIGNEVKNVRWCGVKWYQTTLKDVSKNKVGQTLEKLLRFSTPCLKSSLLKD